MISRESKNIIFDIGANEGIDGLSFALLFKDYQIYAFEPNKDLVKVKNMCSTHAIVYLTTRYWEVVKTATEYSIKNGLAFDLTFASLHRYFNIYGLKRPMFYQSGQSLNTNFKLN